MPAFFKTILTDAAHAAWLGEAVQAAPELAELIDADGRRAIDVAHPACQLRMQLPGQLRAYLFANPLAVPSFFTDFLTNPDHAEWLGEAVKATPSLAGLTDAEGHHATDAAHSACKQAMQTLSHFMRRTTSVDDYCTFTKWPFHTLMILYYFPYFYNSPTH